MQWLVRVFICQNFKLLEISYRGSIITFPILAMIHHYLSRCDLFYKMGIDKTEYLELEITTMSNDVPMMSLQIHCDL